MGHSRYYAFVVAGCLLVSICQAAAPSSTAAVKNAMELDTVYPDMSTAMKAIRNNEKELAAYLSNPDTVCTLFVPTNQAMSDWMRWFGKYAGKAVQNTTFMTSALNYHVVPGTAMTAEQMTKADRQLTRANQTVYFWKKGGEPRVYSRRDFPVSLNQTNVKAGKCIVHTINMALVPPTSNEMVSAWVDEIGLRPDAGPKAQWAPQQQPLPDSMEAKAAKAVAGAPASAVADTPAAGAAAQPARSSAWSVRAAVGGLVMAAVTAAVLL